MPSEANLIFASLLHVVIIATTRAVNMTNETIPSPTPAPSPLVEDNTRGAIIVISTASFLVICILAAVAFAIYEVFMGSEPTSSSQEDLSQTFNHSFINYVSLIDEEADDVGPNIKDVIVVDHDTSTLDPRKKAALETRPDGRQVIHALNPRLPRSAGSLLQLADAYQSVLREAIVAESTKSKRKSPVVLRLEPLGLGYGQGMEKLTFAALSLAYNGLQPSELLHGDNIRLKLCVPVPIESEEESEEEESEEEQDESRDSRVGPSAAKSAAKPKRLANHNLKRIGCCGRGCGKNRSAMFASYSEALKTWQKTAGRPPAGTGQLRKSRNFSWIREGRLDKDRVDRLGSFCQTRNATALGAYGGGVLKRCCGACLGNESGASGRISTRGLIEKTQVVSALSLPQLPANPNKKTMVRGRENKIVIEAAEKELQADKRAKICIVSAAAGYQAGGGFTVGGRHALEEALCTQSTLYGSLESVLEESIANGLEVGRKPYFDSKSAILSPNVTVFREGSGSGYKFKATPYVVNVVSIFMPNKNPQVHDAPLDAPRNPIEYKALVASKIQALLHAAVISGSDILVCPDVGCGVFGNNPAEVGQIVGEEMRKMCGYFSKIVLTGKGAFIDAAMKIMVPTQVRTDDKSDAEEDDDNDEEADDDSLAQASSEESQDEGEVLIQAGDSIVAQQFNPVSGSVSSRLSDGRLRGLEMA